MAMSVPMRGTNTSAGMVHRETLVPLEPSPQNWGAGGAAPAPADLASRGMHGLVYLWENIRQAHSMAAQRVRRLLADRS